MKTKIKLVIIFSIIILAIAIGLILYFKLKPSEDWKQTYQSSIANVGISKDFIQRTDNYNYDDFAVQLLINDFQNREFSKTESLLDSIGDKVYSEVRYEPDLSYEDCLDNKASDVLSRGYGVCSSISKVYLAILRGLGIASKPVVGCVHSGEYYTSIPLRFQDKFSLQATIGKLTMRKPQVQPIEIKNNIAVSKGGIHTWVEVWIPERGWTILEPTTGYLIDINSQDYMILERNPNPFNFCGLSNFQYASFIEQCRNF